MDGETFNHLIKPDQNISQLTQEISNKRSIFYSIDFKLPANENNDPKISANDFWKLAKLTAKNVSLFSDAVLSCEVIEDAPMGFIREMSMQGGLKDKDGKPVVIRVKERVVIDESKKTLLFFQLETSGKILLFGFNQVIEENNQVYFSGHYVYNILKDSNAPQDQAFIAQSDMHAVSRINDMIQSMKKLAFSGQLNQVYQEEFQAN